MSHSSNGVCHSGGLPGNAHRPVPPHANNQRLPEDVKKHRGCFICWRYAWEAAEDGKVDGAWRAAAVSHRGGGSGADAVPSDCGEFDEVWKYYVANMRRGPYDDRASIIDGVGYVPHPEVVIIELAGAAALVD